MTRFSAGNSRDPGKHETRHPRISSAFRTSVFGTNAAVTPRKMLAHATAHDKARCRVSSVLFTTSCNPKRDTVYSVKRKSYGILGGPRATPQAGAVETVVLMLTVSEVFENQLHLPANARMLPYLLAYALCPALQREASAVCMTLNSVFHGEPLGSLSRTASSGPRFEVARDAGLLTRRAVGGHKAAPCVRATVSSTMCRTTWGAGGSTPPSSSSSPQEV